MLQHAQELDELVVQAHIDLYVNSFTSDLGERGYQAIATLLELSANEGLLPRVDQRLLYEGIGLS